MQASDLATNRATSVLPLKHDPSRHHCNTAQSIRLKHRSSGPSNRLDTDLQSSNQHRGSFFSTIAFLIILPHVLFTRAIVCHIHMSLHCSHQDSRIFAERASLSTHRIVFLPLALPASGFPRFPAAGFAVLQRRLSCPETAIPLASSPPRLRLDVDRPVILSARVRYEGQRRRRDDRRGLVSSFSLRIRNLAMLVTSPSAVLIIYPSNSIVKRTSIAVQGVSRSAMFAVASLTTRKASLITDIILCLRPEAVSLSYASGVRNHHHSRSGY